MKKNNPFGWIYFLQNGDPDLCKIGFSIEYNERKKAFETASPNKFKFGPWLPVRAFKSQESELHGLLDKFRIDPKKEWFRVQSKEAKSIILGFCNLIDKNRNEEDEQQLSIISYLEKQSDLYKKYNLIPKWPIEQFTNPDPNWPSEWLRCGWKLSRPDGNLQWLGSSLKEADIRRLEMQYWAKYGRGSVCWFPNDVVEYIRS